MADESLGAEGAAGAAGVPETAIVSGEGNPPTENDINKDEGNAASKQEAKEYDNPELVCQADAPLRSSFSVAVIEDSLLACLLCFSLFAGFELTPFSLLVSFLSLFPSNFLFYFALGSNGRSSGS